MSATSFFDRRAMTDCAWRGPSFKIIFTGASARVKFF
jgi:hypothetical protein